MSSPMGFVAGGLVRMSSAILSLVLALDDGDFAEGFEDCSVDPVEVANSLVSGHIHYVVVLNEHLLESVGAPLTFGQQHKRHAIEEAGEPTRAITQVGEPVVTEANREYLADGVDEGYLSADHPGQGQAAEVKDEDELEWCELLARAASSDTDDENEKEISERRTQNGEYGHGAGAPSAASEAWTASAHQVRGSVPA